MVSMNGVIIPLSGGASAVTFQYHPQEISQAYSATWVPLKVAGRETPYLQYTNGEEDLLEFTLRFASKGAPGYVKGKLEGLQALMKPSGSMGGLQGPPVLQLVLGSDLRWRCVLQGLKTRKHTWHDRNLLWYYADAHLTFSRKA